MRTRKEQDMTARKIAFAALVRQGCGRLAVQERLGISRSEYYRLLGSGREARPMAASARPA